MYRNRILSGLVIILCVFQFSHAIIWYVHPDSSLNSIQAALDSCAAHDTVMVGPGTYYENIVWPNKQGIELVSEYGSDTTIIDGGGYESVVTFPTSASVDTGTVIKEFTITNGGSIEGCGIMCDSDNSPSILFNVITDNSSLWWGGGIFVRSCSPIIQGNIITNNFADYLGAGICCISASPYITYNLIMNNSAYFPGGGIMIDANSSPVLIGDTIISNASGWMGDGICCVLSTVFVDSCTISINDGDGLYCAANSNVEIHNCNITGNTDYGVYNEDNSSYVDATYNWWGDPSGPAGVGPGTGDAVSQYVEYDPWLTSPVGIVENNSYAINVTDQDIKATIFCGPIVLPDNKQCQVIDITGRITAPNMMQPGIYFVFIDGVLSQKIIKIQ
jgi:hypothetical protein